MKKLKLIFKNKRPVNGIKPFELKLKTYLLWTAIDFSKAKLFTIVVFTIQDVANNVIFNVIRVTVEFIYGNYDIYGKIWS